MESNLSISDFNDYWNNDKSDIRYRVTEVTLNVIGAKITDHQAKIVYDVLPTSLLKSIIREETMSVDNFDKLSTFMMENKGFVEDTLYARKKSGEKTPLIIEEIIMKCWESDAEGLLIEEVCGEVLTHLIIDGHKSYYKNERLCQRKLHYILRAMFDDVNKEKPFNVNLFQSIDSTIPKHLLSGNDNVNYDLRTIPNEDGFSVIMRFE